MLPRITACDDVVLLVGADFFFELLPIARGLWGWRSERGEWWIVRGGES